MLKLYNTLTRQKEEFKPLKGNVVTMYSCGPTVYNYAHIGNLRTYVFMDLLRRTLKYEGYKLKGVMNITDVGHLMSDGDVGEDKMVQAAIKQNKSPYEIAAHYTDVFYKDIALLNIEKPEIISKATDHIQDMLNYTIDLFNKGFAYETSDGIYFDIGKFPEYGKLSRLNLDEQIAGARVEVNSEKRHPADFALWKKADPNHIMQWDSPWGKGYPGWHIECSAMSRKYLGVTLDIHTGGVDHIPIHHENEIAQSEAKEGTQTVQFWMHGEFMLVDGGKMSKSLGNTYTVAQLQERNYTPLAFRYFCLNAHYRKKLNFTFEGLDAAQVSYNRLLDLVYRHKMGRSTLPPEILNDYLAQFKAAIEDDVNIPLALGILWTLVKHPFSADIYKLILEFDKVLGLSLNLAAAPKKDALDDSEIPAEIKKLAERRFEARKNKDWKKSDELRDELSALGFMVVDAKDSYSLQKIE